MPRLADREAAGRGRGGLVRGGQLGPAAVKLRRQRGDRLGEGQARRDDLNRHAERGAEDELEHRDRVVPPVRRRARVVGRAAAGDDHGGGAPPRRRGGAAPAGGGGGGGAGGGD